MKVFISWSGLSSKAYAQALNKWFPEVLQDVETWISNQDIEKGTFWATELTQALTEHAVGILCVTPDNLTAPWLHFEAGGLIRGLSKTRVCPILFGGLSSTDIKGPLSLLQFTLPQRDDMFALVKSVNNAAEKPLTATRVEGAFNRCWPELEPEFKRIGESHRSDHQIKARPVGDMVQEILKICRSLQRNQESEATRSLISNILFHKESAPSAVDLYKDMLAQKDLKPLPTINELLGGVATLKPDPAKAESPSDASPQEP